jgi:hypothetical protein
LWCDLGCSSRTDERLHRSLILLGQGSESGVWTHSFRPLLLSHLQTACQSEAGLCYTSVLIWPTAWPCFQYQGKIGFAGHRSLLRTNWCLPCYVHRYSETIWCISSGTSYYILVVFIPPPFRGGVSFLGPAMCTGALRQSGAYLQVQPGCVHPSSI